MGASTDDVRSVLMQLKDEGKIQEIFPSGDNGQVWVVLLTGAVIHWKEFCKYDEYQMIGQERLANMALSPTKTFSLKPQSLELSME